MTILDYFDQDQKLRSAYFVRIIQKGKHAGDFILKHGDGQQVRVDFMQIKSFPKHCIGV